MQDSEFADGAGGGRCHRARIEAGVRAELRAGQPLPHVGVEVEDAIRVTEHPAAGVAAPALQPGALRRLGRRGLVVGRPRVIALEGRDHHLSRPSQQRQLVESDREPPSRQQGTAEVEVEHVIAPHCLRQKPKSIGCSPPWSYARAIQRPVDLERKRVVPKGHDLAFQSELALGMRQADRMTADVPRRVEDPHAT